MAAKEQQPVFGSAEAEDKQFDTISNTGVESGLFRACMKSIRTAHFQSNRTRAVLVVAGLFSDVKVYREVLSCFYAVTKVLEEKLQQKKEEPIVAKLLALGYSFTAPYEKDMKCLYGDGWEKEVEAAVQKNSAAAEYRKKVRNMTKSTELAGAVFVLWGALIIGGGAAAMPRIKSLCGAEATNLFNQVVGPGRNERKVAFVKTWDSLAEFGDEAFEEIVQSSQECMQYNNNMLTGMTRNPWWISYGICAAVGLSSVIAMFVLQKRKANM